MCERLEKARGGNSVLHLAAGALAVLLAYAWPFLMNCTDGSPFLNVSGIDEKIYLARVVDAYRGGTLGNPYLAEWQDAERYMPELGERTLALAARVAHIKPLLAVGISRFLLPVLIYLLLWILARGLGLEPRWAMLAAAMCPLMPSMTWIWALEGEPAYLRYFRAVSPAFYVMLLLVALCMILRVWREPSRWAILAGGVALGALFYTPPYFWSFALIGVGLLALQARGRTRRDLLGLAAVALVVALPSLWGTWQRAHNPDVQATLARFDLLIPGRSPDCRVRGAFPVALVILFIVWFWRRKLTDGGRFLIPFIAVGTGLLIQNMVTNRHLQSYHWVECLIPAWALAGGMFLQAAGRNIRTVWINTAVAVLLAGALFAQAGGYGQWKRVEKECPEFWALDARMPGTLFWLNQYTPRNSVVLASEDIMDSLVLYTHNKVYWADYARQHVIPETEVRARRESLESFQLHRPAGLPFHVDFYVGTGTDCQDLRTGPLLYSNASERTCVTAFLPK